MTRARRLQSIRCIRYVLAILVLWAVYGEQPARAQPSFTAVKCSACPAFTEVDWTFNSSELPGDPNCSAGTCPHYINNIHTWRDVYANTYVKQFQFRVDSFNTENAYDYLEFKEVGGPFTRLSGTPGLGWYGVTSSSQVQQKPIDLLFHTDISVTRPGFRIGRARVCCNASAGAFVPTRALIPLGRTAGVLLGTNDVVYAYVPAEAMHRKNLVLWAAPGRDFDIYARCGALPTPAVWDVRAFSGDPQEFMTFPGTCPSPSIWYIAVHSYSGAGQFNLVSSTAKSDHIFGVRVGTNFAASAAQLATIENSLLQASRQLYGQTEGQMLLSRYDLWNDTGATCGNCGGLPCDICFRDEPGTGYCCDGSQLVIRQWYFADPEGVAHELAHRYLGVPDEYYDVGAGPQWQCGHSNMASPWGSQNNLCFVPGGHQDHERDGTPGASATSTYAAWVTINNSLFANKLFETGDNYDYRDHDFNGAINVVRH